jgi:hypothetical protein
MDERTLKTPTPKCRLCWSFLLGVVKQFVGSESGQKQSVKLLQNMVYNTIQQTPPPQPHTVHLVLRRGGGVEGQQVEEQQNTSIVPLSLGATVHKLGQKYQP